MSEKFDYIQVDTTGFEDKIVKAWDYYKDDINNWLTGFKSIYNKYYSDGKTEISISTENKNITKMVQLYNKEFLDPMNMLIFINSVHENNRSKILNELLGSDSDIKYKFIGVPHYGQTPAIIKEFNVSDLDNINQPEHLDKLMSLSKLVFEVEDISTLIGDSSTNLKKSLKVVCEVYGNNGVAKITSAMYYINPNNFIPINTHTAELFDIPNKYTDSNDFISKYISLCQNIKRDEMALNMALNNDIKLFPLLSSYAFYSKNIVAEIINNFKNSKNIILTGAPGTGKTYSIKSYLKSKLKDNYHERTCFVQFHPNFDYGEFIEGIRPSGFSDGALNVSLQNGIFKEFCKTAFNDPSNEYYFVIDEINRANLSSVFGEILNALEYRIKFNTDNNIMNPEDFIDTQYTHIIKNLPDTESKNLSVSEDNIGKFGIPENIYILATMNDIDKSIDSFDLALRRRFIWVEMPFDENIIRFEVTNNPEILVDKAKILNKNVVEKIGLKSYEIGHAYFLKINNYLEDENPYKQLWEYHLEPLLKEYLRTELSEQDIESKLKEWEKDFIK